MESSSKKIFSQFMYDCRFRGWKYSKKISSLKTLESFLDGHYKKRVYFETFDRKSLRYAQVFVSTNMIPGMTQKYFCSFDYRLKSPYAEKFILKHLKKILKKYDSILFEVPARYKEVMTFLSRNKFQIETISTVGDLKEAKRVLSKDVVNLKQEAPFSYRPMELRDIDIAIKIMRDEFKRNPQYGSEILSKKFCDMTRLLYEKDLKGEHGHFVIDNGGLKVLGVFSSFISRDNPFWGVKGSLSFSIRRSIQGKGYLKYLFHILYREMDRQKVNIVTGSTTHPAIIKESVRLKRKPFCTIFIKDKRCFELKEFERFLNL